MSQQLQKHAAIRENHQLVSVDLKDSKLSLFEQVVIQGDLSALDSTARTKYVLDICESLGLNPKTRPLEYIELDGKLQLYARKDATEQLRKINQVSITKLVKEEINGVYVVEAHAIDKDGRTDVATGAVSVVREGGEWQETKNGKKYFKGNGVFTKLSPNDLANAYMKAETKAKRRVTLSISGLGFLDESELETIPDSAKKVVTQARVFDKTAEKQLPDPLQSIIADWVILFNAAKNGDDLRKQYEKAYKSIESKYGENSKELKAITDAKDKRKSELLGTAA